MVSRGHTINHTVPGANITFCISENQIFIAYCYSFCPVDKRHPSPGLRKSITSAYEGTAAKPPTRPPTITVMPSDCHLLDSEQYVLCSVQD